VDLIRLLDSARGFAMEAGQITLQHYGGRIEADFKGDGTPVTAADRAAEERLRKLIEREWPDHGILGEEFGETRPEAPIRWILDPIDGTKAFMRGVPLYGVLIGIEVERKPIVGVAHFPALGETVSAARGYGCVMDRRSARVSTCDRLDEALMCATNIRSSVDGPFSEAMGRCVRAVKYARGWGDCYGHVLVATGRADIMIDPELNIWDAAPLLPILTEAGGRFTDTSGRETIHGGSGISTNGLLHDEVLELYGG